MEKPSDARKALEEDIIKNPDTPQRVFAERHGYSRPHVQNVINDLRLRGLISPSRRSKPSRAINRLREVESLAGAPSFASKDPSGVAGLTPSLITPAELEALGATEFTEETDEETRKKLLARCRAIALDLSMHPDTVLSASQVYIKLTDAVRTKALGPGRPMTHADAVARLAALMQACGTAIVHEAITSAFGGTNAAKSSGSEEPVHSPDSASAAVGPASTSGSDPRIDSDEDSGRPSDVG